MSLIEKVKCLDNFLNDRYLEKEYTKDRFDFNGVDYDDSINTESYFQKYCSSDGFSNNVEIIFEKFQESEFQNLLKDMKRVFVGEYILSYVSLAEKIVFASSLKENLETKLEKFRNHKIGRKYAPLLSEFIKNLSIEYIDVIDSNSKTLSFHFRDKFSHRDTLNKLFKTLIDEGLISKDTSQIDFLNLFKNKQVNNIVAWLGSTSELKYFISLINEEKFGFENKGNYKWRIAVKCFVKVSPRTLKLITYKDLRTYKVTPNAKLKLDKTLSKVLIPI